MELDSGAPTGIISKKTLHAIKLNSSKLQPTDRQFVSYSQHVNYMFTSLMKNTTLYLALNGLVNLFMILIGLKYLVRRQSITSKHHLRVCSRNKALD